MDLECNCVDARDLFTKSLLCGCNICRKTFLALQNIEIFFFGGGGGGTSVSPMVQRARCLLNEHTWKVAFISIEHFQNSTPSARAGKKPDTLERDLLSHRYRARHDTSAVEAH